MGQNYFTGISMGENTGEQSVKHYSTCTLCEAICGIEVTTSGRQIVSVTGDKANPFSQGHVCPKAIAMKDLYDDPDRIRTPLKKVDGRWQEVSWDEALDEVAERLFSLQQSYGDDAVGLYLGNPNAHNMGSILFGPYFYHALRTHNRFSATSVDQLPHHIVCRQMFGHQLQIPIPDIDHTSHFLIIGGNPLASNGSIMTVPNVKKRLKQIQQRGGQVVVIDPKRTETAKLSDQHHFIRPGTDVLLLLAMLNYLFESGQAAPGRLADWVADWPSVSELCAPYPPERVASLTGIAAHDIKRMVDEFCAAESAICYGRMGASVQSFGTLCQYLIMLFNILTGNLDRRGGMMFTQPAADTLPHSGRGSLKDYRSRVSALPAFAGEFPVACLAEEILTPGDGQIKALVLGAGNPVLTTPNGTQLDKALQQLDFVVAVDFYVTESTRHADIILPPVTGLERDHYDVVFHKFAVRNYAKFSPAVFPMQENARTDWQIYLDLAERLDAKRGKSTAHYSALREKQPSGVVDDLLRSGRYADGDHQLSLDRLSAHPHGIDLGPLQPELPEALYHEDGKIALALAYFCPDLIRVERHFFVSQSAAQHNSDEMLLIGRRHIRSNNSWLHNNDRMVKGQYRCAMQIHPQDAQRLGIFTGSQAQVTSRVGELQVSCEVTQDIMPGVVSIPHGWGHDKSDTGWQIARAHSGVNVNQLTDEKQLDVLSGNAVLNGVPVIITAVLQDFTGNSVGG